MARPIKGIGFSLVQLEKFLKDGKARVGKLQKQRAKLEKQLAVIDREMANLGGASRGFAGGAGGTRPRNESNLNDTIFKILEKANGPMRVGDILKAVEGAGYVSSSANFRGIINQALIKDKRFAKGDQRGTYLAK